MALWRSWTGSQPEALLESAFVPLAQNRFKKLYDFLCSGKLEVCVLPDEVFGLVHGKAGVITLADGSNIYFTGSANESKSGWLLNYELVWEDSSLEAIVWIQEEFDALWSHPLAVPLSEAVVQDFGRLALWQVINTIDEWMKKEQTEQVILDHASVMIETPVYRKEVGRWERQKYFVKKAFAHHGPTDGALSLLTRWV